MNLAAQLMRDNPPPVPLKDVIAIAEQFGVNMRDTITYYQWDDGTIQPTDYCSNKLGCPYAIHNKVNKGVYWAWDRSLGTWVHYAR